MSEAVRALRIVLRYRLLALRHRLAGLVIRSAPAPPAGGTRRGQAGPSGSAGVVLLGAGFLLLATGVARAFVLGLDSWVMATGAVPRTFSSGARWTATHASGVALWVAVALLVLAGLGLGLRDPRRLSSRVEELLALPAPASVAFAAEVGERALGQPLLWLSIWPLLTSALTGWGWGRAALLAALPVAAAHALTLSVLEFGLAAALQRARAGAVLRSVLLGASLLTPVALLSVVAMMAGQPETLPRPLVAAMSALAPLALASPAGLGLLPLQGRHGGWGTWVPVASTLLFWLAGFALATRLAARGWESVAGTSRGRTRDVSPLRRLPGPVAEELLALGRDRVALTVQVLVPIAFLALNAWGGPHRERMPEPLRAALPVFAGAILVLPAARVLPRLGESVWLLLAVSRPLTRLALERAAVWAGAGLLAGLLVLAAAGTPSLERSAVTLGFGLPALALAAAALGLLGLDPRPGAPRKLGGEASATLAALIMVLGAAAAAPHYRGHVVLLAMLAGLAAALWQRARASVPWLLEPHGRGTRPLDAADGLKALILYFGLEVLLSTALRGSSFGGFTPSDVQVVLVAQPLATLMALGLTVDPLVKQGLSLGRLLPLGGRGGPGDGPALALAVPLGVFMVGLGWFHYALLDRALGGVPADWAHPAIKVLRENPLIAVTVTLTAPLAEELIFRGLLQQGLRATLGPRAALGLATLAFALIHQPQDWAAVFAIGLCLAWLFERTGHLGACWLAHAVNNGVELALAYARS